MKKVTRILGLCALVALATVSCKKNENTNEGGKSFFATINQPTNGAKTHIGDEDYLFWDAEEQIKVYTENGEAYGTFTNKSGAVKKAEFTGEIVESDKYVAFYPVTNIGDQIILKVNPEQTYVADNFGKGEYPMAAFNQGDDFLFRSPCAVVCLPLKGNAKINTITLSDKGGKMLAGNFNVNLDGFNPATWSTYGYNGTSASVVLNCNQQLTSTATNFYFVVAAPETLFADGIQFEIEYEGGSKTLTSTNDNALEAETILTMPAAEVNEPVFSVANNRKVLFSQGNLYHSTDGFHFEEKQTDFTEWNTAHQSYFVWSRNAETALAQNWGAVESGIDYIDVFFTNATAITPNPSFAVDNVAGTWRTLSRGEWEYLLGSRSGLRYARATVNGVHGLLLFPDGYALPTGYTTDGGIGMSKVNVADITYPSETIPAETWTAMESAGVVFLPAAGDYDYYDYNVSGFGAGSSFKGMEYVGVAGKYWASDCNATELFQSEAALFCEDDHNLGHYLVTGITVHRYDHQCIRLVRTL